VTAMLDHTIEKHDIPADAKLRVIAATHGSAGGYLDGAECDSYLPVVNALSRSLTAELNRYLELWTGTAEAVHAESEFTQATHAWLEDLARPTTPFGKLVGVGEIIDQSINGRYVNQLGEVVDNGVDNYDYIVVLPITWDTEVSDSIIHLRTETLGNHHLARVQGQEVWIRQDVDQNGEDYGPSAHDDAYYTVRQMDASGWATVPAAGGEPVAKGSTTNPTTVIITGAVFSLGEGPHRDRIADAAVRAIGDLIEDPMSGGWVDRTCLE